MTNKNDAIFKMDFLLQLMCFFKDGNFLGLLYLSQNFLFQACFIIGICKYITYII